MTRPKPERRLTPPDGRELRLVDLRDVTVRQDEDPAAPIGFRGTAAVFNRPTRIGGRWGWWEQLDRGFFDSALSRPDDTRMLKNHNTDLPLARVTAGNLRLSTSDEGLATDADMVPTTYARDLALTLDTGVVTQMSFAFSLAADKWEILQEDQPWGGREGDELRTLLDASFLWDVSPVTFPAYEDTDASLKSFDAFCHELGIDQPAERQRLAVAIRSGDPSPDLAAALHAAATRLEGPATPHASGSPNGAGGDASRDADTPEPDPIDRMREHRWAELTKTFREE
jgi:HK97 family phage prohead protease